MWLIVIYHFMFFLLLSPLIFWLGMNAMLFFDKKKFIDPASTPRQKLWFGGILVSAFWAIFFLTI